MSVGNTVRINTPDHSIIVYGNRIHVNRRQEGGLQLFRKRNHQSQMTDITEIEPPVEPVEASAPIPIPTIENAVETVVTVMTEAVLAIANLKQRLADALAAPQASAEEIKKAQEEAAILKAKVNELTVGEAAEDQAQADAMEKLLHMATKLKASTVE